VLWERPALPAVRVWVAAVMNPISNWLRQEAGLSQGGRLHCAATGRTYPPPPPGRAGPGGGGRGAGQRCCALTTCVLACTAPRHPAPSPGRLRARRYDLPTLAAASQCYLRAEGVQEQCAFQTHDFFSSQPFPAGHDVITMSMVLHDWGLAKKQQLIAKVGAGRAASARVRGGTAM